MLYRFGVLVCPRCRGLVQPGSSICPTCAYDPVTGDTALNPPRAGRASGTSTTSIVLSGLTVLVAVVLVIGIAQFYLRNNVFKITSAPRPFTTESGSTPGS